MRFYVFVDGENHFHRSQEMAQDVFGPRDALYRLSTAFHLRGKHERHFPPGPGPRFLYDADSKFFWDRVLFYEMGITQYITRAIYVTAFTGSKEELHNARIRIRCHGFEPIVIQETKDLFKSRKSTLDNYKVLDKPKGCDIALTTRMVTDAASNLFDVCCLFTSDADFLPAIEAVRRMGKVVHVYGCKKCLPKESPYLYIPDEFYDLRETFELLADSSAGPVTEIMGKS